MAGPFLINRYTGTVNRNAAGQIVSIDSAAFGGRGTAQSFDTQLVMAGTSRILLERWSNGRTQGTNAYDPRTYGPNEGVHLLIGERTTTTPTTGTFTYQLAGATRPTTGNGSAEPGTLTGTFGVAFGSTFAVGYDLSLAIGGSTYGMKSAGGSSNPSLGGLIIGNGSFTGGGQTTGGGGLCGGAAACPYQFTDAFYGPSAEGLGIIYTVGSGSGAASGAAAFTRR